MDKTEDLQCSYLPDALASPIFMICTSETFAPFFGGVPFGKCWKVFEEVASFLKSEKGTIVSKFGGTLPYLRLLARPSHNQAASARLGSSLGLLRKLVSNQNSFP